MRDDPNKMVTSYTSAGCVLFDLETGQAVTRLDTDQVRWDLVGNLVSKPLDLNSL